MSRLIGQFGLDFGSFHFQATLDVPLKGVLAVLGVSGCGKTTLLRCLAGLERSPTGYMQYGDVLVQNEASGIFIPFHQRSIAYVFQEPRLFPHLSVFTNLKYGEKRRSTDLRSFSFDDVVQVLGIEHLLSRLPGKLSGGEQQRVAIGRAILTNPNLLLLDEPLSSLDGVRKAEVLPFLQRLTKEFRMPMVYVSHSLQEVLQFADSVLLLRAGTVMTCGSLPEVFSQFDVRGTLPVQEVGAVLETHVVGHEPQFGLTHVQFFGRSLYVSKQDLPVGAALRVHIHSRDVSLFVGEKQGETSVLNVLEGTVLDCRQSIEDEYSVDVKIDIGCPLLANVTKKSFAQLKLSVGQQVFASVKTVAISQDF
ncbi:MAG: molybdenum ABC transporter ATP-binding protein [Nitrospirales bacterium]